MKNICFLMGVLALASLATLPASAGILYNNDFGGVVSGDNYNEDAFTLDYGFEVGNSFVLSSNATIQSVDIALWEFPGDSLTSVDWQILANNGANPLSGTVLESGTAFPVSTFIENNSFSGSSYPIYDASFSIAPLALSGGTTYWLTLQNAVVPNGDPIYWDQSDGPSTFYHNTLGYFPGPPGGYSCGGICTGSESFRLYGPTSGVPEPGTLLLLGGALIALAGIRRKK
jgi:hypothetical protein